LSVSVTDGHELCNKQSDKGVSLLCRLAAELESEVPAEGPGKGPSSEGMQEAVPVDGEVLEKLRGMEQQVQMALLELKKKDQQLAREKSSTGRFKVRRIYLATKLSVLCTRVYVAVSVCLFVCGRPHLWLGCTSRWCMSLNRKALSRLPCLAVMFSIVRSNSER